jgi:hypothetical protein
VPGAGGVEVVEVLRPAGDLGDAIDARQRAADGRYDGSNSFHPGI